MFLALLLLCSNQNFASLAHWYCIQGGVSNCRPYSVVAVVTTNRMMIFDVTTHMVTATTPLFRRAQFLCIVYLWQYVTASCFPASSVPKQYKAMQHVKIFPFTSKLTKDKSCVVICRLTALLWTCEHRTCNIPSSESNVGMELSASSPKSPKSYYLKEKGSDLPPVSALILVQREQVLVDTHSLRARNGDNQYNTCALCNMRLFVWYLIYIISVWGRALLYEKPTRRDMYAPHT